jgi:hypothetical protein
MIVYQDFTAVFTAETLLEGAQFDRALERF